MPAGPVAARPATGCSHEAHRPCSSKEDGLGSAHADMAWRHIPQPDFGRIFGRCSSQTAWASGLRGGNVFGTCPSTVQTASPRRNHRQPEISEKWAPAPDCWGAKRDGGWGAASRRASGCGIFPSGVRGAACPLFSGAGAGLRPRRADLWPFQCLKEGREALLGGLGARAGASPAGLARWPVVVLTRICRLVQQRRQSVLYRARGAGGRARLGRLHRLHRSPVGFQKGRVQGALLSLLF